MEFNVLSTAQGHLRVSGDNKRPFNRVTIVMAKSGAKGPESKVRSLWLALS